MIDKLLLVKKDQEIGLIVISRIIGLFSLIIGLSLFGLFKVTDIPNFFMLGRFIMKISLVIHTVFILALIVKAFKKVEVWECILSILYLGVNFPLERFYEYYLTSSL